MHKAQAIIVFLKVKEKGSYLIDNPSARDKSEFKNWKKDNSMVCSWLWNSMKPQIAYNYMLVATAKEVWEATLDLYFQK